MRPRSRAQTIHLSVNRTALKSINALEPVDALNNVSEACRQRDVLPEGPWITTPVRDGWAIAAT